MGERSWDGRHKRQDLIWWQENNYVVSIAYSHTTWLASRGAEATFRLLPLRHWPRNGMLRSAIGRGLPLAVIFMSRSRPSNLIRYRPSRHAPIVPWLTCIVNKEESIALDGFCVGVGVCWQSWLGRRHLVFPKRESSGAWDWQTRELSQIPHRRCTELAWWATLQQRRISPARQAS